MIFSSIEFVLFFAVVFVGHWLLPGRRMRQVWLLAASLFFYAWWDWRFLGLISIVIVIADVSGRLIQARPALENRILAVAVAALLGILAIFKYANFFVDSAIALLSQIGLQANSSTLNIILPVGISFYIFQAISYIVDVKRKQIGTERDFVATAFYIAFFPQLVAGPIVRAIDFLPQTKAKTRLTKRDLYVGLKLFTIGYLYKSVFADNIAPIIDPVYADLAGHSNSDVLWSSIGFYSQIYFDFAGYSLMAIAVARMFGYRLNQNFRFPYLATSITDFWRRWHISLSSWLRDYLYIPLGGNRGGEMKRERNLTITMLLGGLWHGASWNFVVWGFLHGAALSVSKFAAASPVGRFLDRAARFAPIAIALVIGSWLLTQVFVLLLWVPFRASDFSETLTALSAMSFLRPDADLARTIINNHWILWLPVAADTFLVSGWLKERLKLGEWAVPHWAYMLGLGAVLAIALTLIPFVVANFIYFQF